MNEPTTESGKLFTAHKQRLFGLAYRMLGSRAEAEDVVQDAFVRYAGCSDTVIDDPPRYLTTIVARLCLDRLRSAHHRRETYVGTWLPEPVLAAPLDGPDHTVELADDLSISLLVLLDRLSPPERAAFLLHDVFDEDFDSIAKTLGRTPAGCRKLAERARSNIRANHPRFEVPASKGEDLCQAFLQATNQGDISALSTLLAQDAVLYSDGGGKRRAALKPIFGSERIVRFLMGIRKKPSAPVPKTYVLRWVNQMPAIIFEMTNGDHFLVALEVQAGKIAQLYFINNPDKLHGVVTA